MGFLHASTSSPALCRACGAAIRTGELRFGNEEGEGAARRLRWLHVGCAAESLPDALFRVLEMGGWQAVPKEDHYELRRLMGDARERDATSQGVTTLGLTQDESGSLWSPGWLRGLWQRCSSKVAAPWVTRTTSTEATVAVSSPAIANVEVLLRPSRARELTPELQRAWVFADALQSRGDPRGELLALELAAALASESEPGRALQRSAHATWQRFAPSLAGSLRASPALRLRWCGGFLLGARPRGGAEISGLLASPAASSLTRIRVEFCTQEELGRLVAGVVGHRRPLVQLDLPDSRLSDLSGLYEIETLRALRVGDRFDPALLERLPELRALGLGGRAQPSARELAAAPELERLELVGPQASDLEGLARHLPRLRELTLTGMTGMTGMTGTSASEGPRFLAGAERLERLCLPDTPIRSLAELPALPRLRALTLVPANLPLVRELGRMRGLERLALLGGKVGELDSIAALERLEHLALSATRVADLNPLRSLPRLRSLVLEGGDLRRMAGLAQLGLERLELLRVANLDLGSIAGLVRLRALTLDLGGRRPRQLDALERMTELRELTIPQALLDELQPIARTLGQIEVLTLEGGERPPRAKLLQALPKLRRLILPGHDPAALARMAEALPGVAIEGDPAPHDLLGLCDPFDWRALTWPDAPAGERDSWTPRVSAA